MVLVEGPGMWQRCNGKHVKSFVIRVQVWMGGWLQAVTEIGRYGRVVHSKLMGGVGEVS